ncbi:MAG: septation protein SpoVG family protein [Melioribacteraceae bacterium]|nr:septation protein SpoVG family protein [Melioribacteraceae bacterium]
MTVSRLFILTKSEGNTRAFIDITTDEGIIIKGFKLIHGPTGLFVGAPSEKGKDGKWRESVVIPKELRDELNRMAVSEYDRLRTNENSGSIQPPVEDDTDLPF